MPLTLLLILIAGIAFIVIWSKKRGQQQNDPQPRQNLRIGLWRSWLIAAIVWTVALPSLG